MKLTGLFLVLATAPVFGQASAYTNFIRQTQQGTGVVWDMTSIAATGSSTSPMALAKGGSLFQLWTVNGASAKDYLLDQKLVGAYLPKADVVITTLDPYATVKRTRVDKPFTVQITASDILAAGTGIPDAATKVLLEQHIATFPTGSTTLDAAVVAANTATYKGYISQNGKSSLAFAASSLKVTPDPTKAQGEEHFIVHALADGTITQTQIASAKVQVWPVASGAISGITSGMEYRAQVPTVTLNMMDLYPRSDTYFYLYQGATTSGNPTLIHAVPWDSNVPKTTSMTTDELNKKIAGDGIYTVALVSTTVYGTELLAPTVTFTVRRALTVNAMQVNFSDGTEK